MTHALCLLAFLLADASADPAALVRQLGDPSFETRQAAGRALEALGPAAVAPLKAALSDPDPEVRRACASLLRVVERTPQQRQLDFFLISEADPRAGPLPGWKALRGVLGGDRAGRSAYIDLALAEPDLLAALEKDPAAFAGRLQGVVAEVNTLSNPQRRVEEAERRRKLTTLLLMAAAPARLDINQFNQAISTFYQPENLNAVRGSPALQALFETILVRAADDPNAIGQVANLAQIAGFQGLIATKLRPRVLRQLDQALQPYDINRLYQPISLAVNLGLKKEAAARVAPALRRLAAEGDPNQLQQLQFPLQILDLKAEFETVLFANLRGRVREAAGASPDLQRLLTLASVCQQAGFAEGLEVLRPAACKALIAYAERPEQAGPNIYYAQALIQTLGLKEASEGVLGPALRARLIPALETGDFQQIVQVYYQLQPFGQAAVAEETLKPFLRRRTAELLGPDPSMTQLQSAFGLVQNLRLDDVRKNALEPAFERFLVAAATRPLDIGATQQAISLNQSLKLKQIVPLALRAALEPKMNGYIRGMGISAVAELGTEAELRRLETLLTNTEAPFGSVNANGVVTSPQIRDIVLGALVLKSGQALKDYGFNTQFGIVGLGNGFTPWAFSFPDDGARTKAQEKWKKYAAENRK